MIARYPVRGRWTTCDIDVECGYVIISSTPRRFRSTECLMPSSTIHLHFYRSGRRKCFMVVVTTNHRLKTSLLLKFDTKEGAQRFIHVSRTTVSELRAANLEFIHSSFLVLRTRILSRILKNEGGSKSCTGPPLQRIPVPSKLDILLLVVGTEGDIIPMLIIASRFVSDGHRVKVATHQCHRRRVEAYGSLLFTELAGDPSQLAKIMVESQGLLLPIASLTALTNVWENLRVLGDIVDSCAAAITPEPASDFRANAIIANPVVYGGKHVAEALGAPLHLMFPQPWVPTRAFPHTMVGSGSPVGWSLRNRVTYDVFDSIIWLVTRGIVNNLRTKKLGLPSLVYSDDRAQPFTHLYSPTVAPKPLDWNSSHHTVGYVSSSNTTTTTHARDHHQDIPQALLDKAPCLAHFLACDKHRPPVYFGFGSMSLSSPADEATLLDVILEAAVRVEVRVIVQASRGFLNASTPLTHGSALTFFDERVRAVTSRAHLLRRSGASRWGACDAFLLTEGPIPHDLLFPLCRASVHHGGSGTVHTAMSSGRPTWVLPFFGDQFFWGACVARLGVGPPPCPVRDVTPDKVIGALRVLFADSTRATAMSFAQRIKNEDGCAGAVQSFYRHLPLDTMLCQVSPFLVHASSGMKGHRAQTASYYCGTCGLLMCARVAHILHRNEPSMATHRLQPWCSAATSSKWTPEHLPEGDNVDTNGGSEEKKAVWDALQQAQRALQEFHTFHLRPCRHDDPVKCLISTADLARTLYGASQQTTCERLKFKSSLEAHLDCFPECKLSFTWFIFTICL